jgi:PhnB protein
MRAYKPEGYTSVAPYLMVENASRTIDFLVAALEAVELRRFPGKAGRIMHAEVRIDDTVIMLADRPADWPPIDAHVHIYVPDVDASYERALEAGATAVQPVKTDAPDRRAGVRDAGGTTWWIASQIS